MKKNINVVELRKKSGLKMHELATMTGLAPSSIRNLELGKDVKVSTVRRVAKFYNIKPEELLKQILDGAEK